MNADRFSDSGGGATERRLLAAGAMVALGAIAGAALVTLIRPSFDHATGSWFVIAYDLLDGTFCRPLIGEAGYGGTRYFPLYPVLVSLLSFVGIGYVKAALIVNMLACGLVATGLYVALRLMKLDPFLAGVFASFGTSSFGAMITLTSLRGDLLPTALAIWGVAFGIAASTKGAKPWALLAAGLCFSLAFTAKPTAVFWVIGVLAWYVATGRRDLAIRLGGWTALGIAGFVAVAQVASDGRFLEQLAVTIGGGGGFLRVLAGPLIFERFLRGSDPLGYLAVLTAIVLLLTVRNEAGLRLPGYLFGSILAMTILVFGSLGTIQNHLVDIHPAAILVIAPNFGRLRTRVHLAPAVMLVYAMWLGGVYNYEYWLFSDEYDRDRAVEWVRNQPGRVLSEHPAVAIFAGKQPYLADGFMLRSIRSAVPEVDARLRNEIAHGFYSMVVLTHSDRGWYDKVHFGPGFLDLLETHYEQTEQLGKYRLFQVRGGASTE